MKQSKEDKEPEKIRPLEQDSLDVITVNRQLIYTQGVGFTTLRLGKEVLNLYKELKTRNKKGKFIHSSKIHSSYETLVRTIMEMHKRNMPIPMLVSIYELLD